MHQQETHCAWLQLNHAPWGQTLTSTRKLSYLDHAIHSTPSSTQTIDQNNAAKRSIKTALHKSSQPHQLLHLQGDVEAPSCTAAQFLISEVVLVLSISTAQANTSHAPSLCTPAQYNKGAQAANTVSKGVLIRQFEFKGRYVYAVPNCPTNNYQSNNIDFLLPR